MILRARHYHKIAWLKKDALKANDKNRHRAEGGFFIEDFTIIDLDVQLSAKYSWRNNF